MLTTAPRKFSTVFLSVLVFAKSFLILPPTPCSASVRVADIDVDHAPNLVMVDFRRSRDLLDTGDGIQRSISGV